MAMDDNFVGDLMQVFDAAVSKGVVTFNSTGSTKVIRRRIGASEVDFQITELAHLAHRPDNISGKLPGNPFEKPEPDMTVRDTFGENGEFRIVLNKFPVIPYHFLLVTKEFESQNSPLTPSQLYDTFCLLVHLKQKDSKNWFAFYNCGSESGASQPHKHVQFLTFPENFVPFPQTLTASSTSFIPDANKEPLQNSDLPFAHFVAKLPTIDALDKETMSMCFSALLQSVLNIQRHNNSSHISYNVVLTTEYIMLVPRSHSKFKSLGVNSCGVIGLFLCKNSELASMVEDETPEHILLQCGYPNSVEKNYTEYDY